MDAKNLLCNILNVTSIDGISPLEVTFSLVARLAKESGLAARVDEETMTAALLGAMAATFIWPMSIMGCAGRPDCAWVRYRKGGKAEDSESKAGADFALFVRRPNEKVRVAIFQAKMFKRKTNRYIEVHHVPASANNDPARSQFVSLRDLGLKALRKAKKDDVFSKLKFVHYLGYADDGTQCIPVSQMSSLNDWYETNSEGDPGDASKILEASSDWSELEDVLRSGCAGRNEHGHWLEMDEAEALEVFRSIIPLMRACEANDGSGGPRLFPSVYEVARVGSHASAGKEWSPTKEELEEAEREALDAEVSSSSSHSSKL